MWSEVGASAEDSITSATPITSAPYVSRHQSVANSFTVDLAGLKEMTWQLAGLLKLTLPVPFKEQAHRMARCQ